MQAAPATPADLPEPVAPAAQLPHDGPAEPTAEAAPMAPLTPPAVPELSPTACAAQLAALFPAVFAPGAPKPLKLRIQVDIQQRAPGTFTKRVLSHFLQRHTTGTAYLKALVNAPHRLDLDGAPAGEPTDEHRQAAVAELERRRALHDARRAAERTVQRDAQRNELREAQRKAQDEARRAYEADAQARGQRDALLRAFEATTLTRKNFCALKGVAEAELDTVLERARHDREQQRMQAQRPTRPPERPPEARRDERGQRPERGRPPHQRAPTAGKPQR